MVGGEPPARAHVHARRAAADSSFVMRGAPHHAGVVGDGAAAAAGLPPQHSLDARLRLLAGERMWGERQRASAREDVRWKVIFLGSPIR